jgi:hypothetical protein
MLGLAGYWTETNLGAEPFLLSGENKTGYGNTVAEVLFRDNHDNRSEQWACCVKMIMLDIVQPSVESVVHLDRKSNSGIVVRCFRLVKGIHDLCKELTTVNL